MATRADFFDISCACAPEIQPPIALIKFPLQAEAALPTTRNAVLVESPSEVPVVVDLHEGLALQVVTARRVRIECRR